MTRSNWHITTPICFYSLIVVSLRRAPGPPPALRPLWVSTPCLLFHVHYSGATLAVEEVRLMVSTPCLLFRGTSAFCHTRCQPLSSFYSLLVVSCIGRLSGSGCSGCMCVSTPCLLFQRVWHPGRGGAACRGFYSLLVVSGLTMPLLMSSRRAAVSTPCLLFPPVATV